MHRLAADGEGVAGQDADAALQAGPGKEVLN